MFFAFGLQHPIKGRDYLYFHPILVTTMMSGGKNTFAQRIDLQMKLSQPQVADNKADG